MLPAKKIANPVGNSDRHKILLCVGRLSYQKNLEVLIKAFSLITDEFQDWTLQIIGDGENLNNLNNIVAESNIQNKVELRGAIKDIETAYEQANLFCLPSRWEGFPNALAEALAHGLPAVGFSECAGVNSLIQSGKNGLLASGNNDPMTLAKALQQLMASPDNRRDMGQEAIETVALYKPDAVFDQWERLFLEVSGRGEI